MIFLLWYRSINDAKTSALLFVGLLVYQVIMNNIAIGGQWTSEQEYRANGNRWGWHIIAPTALVLCVSVLLFWENISIGV